MQELLETFSSPRKRGFKPGRARRCCSRKARLLPQRSPKPAFVLRRARRRSRQPVLQPGRVINGTPAQTVLLLSRSLVRRANMINLLHFDLHFSAGNRNKKNSAICTNTKMKSLWFPNRFVISWLMLLAYILIVYNKYIHSWTRQHVETSYVFWC